MGDSSGAAAVAAVEAEGKLLEVAVEVFAAHRPLVRAEDPAFDEREEQMNPRQHLCCGPIELGQHRDDVPIAGLAELRIAAPAVVCAVSLPPRCFSTKALRASAETSAIGASRTRPQLWPRFSPPRRRRLLPSGTLPRLARFRTAEVALVDLDLAGQRRTIGANHLLHALIDTSRRATSTDCRLTDMMV